VPVSIRETNALAAVCYKLVAIGDVYMDGVACFRFFGSLNDFLFPGQKGKTLPYAFSGAPAIKDAIEAIGVPHPEVDVILVNGSPVVFTHPLRLQDQVEVYPVQREKQWPKGYSLSVARPSPERFVLDVHLGKLARALRMLGFDSCYENSYLDSEIALIAETENRVVLTRDIGLLKQKVIRWGYWLRSQHLHEQLAEVVRYFDLVQKLKPFTRCLVCNGAIIEVPKESIIDRLPPKTRLYFHRFYQCSCCKKVYWKGSHYNRMLEFVKQHGKVDECL
jgi:uncharacterized protein with PIN domain